MSQAGPPSRQVTAIGAQTSVLLPVGHSRRVSSYQNAGVPKATFQIGYRNGGGWDQPSLPRNSSGNLARAYNDLATKLYVIC